MKRVAWGLLVATIASCTPPASRDVPDRKPTTSAASAARKPAPTPKPVADASVVKTVPDGPVAQIGPGGSRSVSSRAGLVVSIEKHATRAGVAILERGGNAADAAIAAAYVLAVTHPSAGNIGGGGFALVRNASGPIAAIDFRETAPRSLDRARFRKMIRAKARGPLAAGVPGSVAGLELLRERFAKLPRAALLEPAISLARRGHRVGSREALTLRWSWPSLREDKEARRIFAQGKGPIAAGKLLVRRDLADTLSQIAKQGRAGFYEGPIGERLSRATAGAITMTDLKEYRAVERQPLRTRYRGIDVHIMPPPSAGGVTLSLILQQMRHVKAWQQQRDSAHYLHLFLESSRRAQVRRRFLVRDPDAIEADEQATTIAQWLDAQSLLASAPIDAARATPSAKLHPLFEAALAELEHTTHLSVVDRDGMAVSMTVTLSAGFGAKFVAPGTGVVLNNSVASFASMGDNPPVAGRRTTSSMAPTIATRNGELLAVLGSPGGDTIPSTIAQVFLHLTDGKATLEDAVDAPRVHHGFVPDEVRFERRRPPARDVLKALEQRGHRLSRNRIPMGDANNIVVHAGVGYGYADEREGGLALAARPSEP